MLIAGADNIKQASKPQSVEPALPTSACTEPMPLVDSALIFESHNLTSEFHTQNLASTIPTPDSFYYATAEPGFMYELAPPLTDMTATANLFQQPGVAFETHHHGGGEPSRPSQPPTWDTTFVPEFPSTSSISENYSFTPGIPFPSTGNAQVLANAADVGEGSATPVMTDFNFSGYQEGFWNNMESGQADEVLDNFLNRFGSLDNY